MTTRKSLRLQANENFRSLKDRSPEEIRNFLMDTPPESLAYYCSLDMKIMEICSDINFVREYSLRHSDRIRRRQTFPKSVNSEIAPLGYKVIRSWHPGFETWALELGIPEGIVDHFNIVSINGPDTRIYHVYHNEPVVSNVYDAEFMILDEKGKMLYAY